MNELTQSTVERLLSDYGWKALLPVYSAASRPGCTVWNAGLFTLFGDARVQIQVYAFQQQREAIIDYEEEITALLDNASSIFLAQEIRTEEWGILITCAPEDADTCKRFFEEGLPEEQAITYHPQLDRILGGDYFHQLQGHWLKACLYSLPHAMEIKDWIAEAKIAYHNGPSWPGKLERPLPELLAILQVPAKELKGAPIAYNELALMQFIIGSPEVIRRKPASGEDELLAFARQLFGFLASQHEAGLCCNRKGGSCLRPEFLLADGSLTDVYFGAHPTKGKPFQGAVRVDLWNALSVTCEMGEDARMIATALSNGFMQYARLEKLPDDVVAHIESTSQSFLNKDPKGLEALMEILMIRTGHGNR